MWKKRYILAVGLCLLLTSWFLSQALYQRIVMQHAASQDTAAKSAAALTENNTTEESRAINQPPVQADESSQGTTPLPTARPTAVFAARIRQEQRAVAPAQKDTLAAAATHQPSQKLIPQADRPIDSEFPASAEETTTAEPAAITANEQTIDSLTITNVHTRTPLSAVVVQLPFAQVEAETLVHSAQPADSSTIADLLSQAQHETAEPRRPAKETPGVVETEALVHSAQPADSSTIADVLPQALAEEFIESQRATEEASNEVEAEILALSMQPADSSTIADVHAEAPPSAADVQQPPSHTAVSREEAVALSTQPEDTLATKKRGKTNLSVVVQNRADVDEEKIYEDILNLIKSKMALNQSTPPKHSEPTVVLASHGSATAEPAPSLRPVQQTRPARHGIGLALGTAQPDMAEKVRTPIFAEMHYRYQSTPRTLLQVAAGAAPLLWPGGRQTLQISADLIGRYGLFVHRRIQPNLSFGLGMLSTGMQKGPSLASGTLLAGTGVNLSLAQQWNLGVQVQYKYCLQNPASNSSMQRDGYLQIKTELTFNLRQLSTIRLQSEENYLAEKQ